MAAVSTFFASWWFPAIVTYVMVGELLSAKVPSTLSTALAGGFFGLAIAMGMPLQFIGMHALVAILVMTLGYYGFNRGWVAPDDVRLASAVALWLGAGQTLVFLLLAGLIGCMIAFMLTVIRTVAPAEAGGPSWARWLSPAEGMPYGVAIGFAALCIYPESILMNAPLL